MIILSLALRIIVSLFNDNKTSSFVTGACGQFQLQLTEGINTDSFFDFLTTNVMDKAH